MSRIGGVGQLSSIQLGLLNALAEANSSLGNTSLRLSTLKKINHAADNPAGLVMANNLQAELNAVDSASSNVTNAQSLISTADSAAGDIVTQLQTAQSLALDVAGGTLSATDKAAKQAQLDDVLSAIDRSAQTAYNGTRLLDGSSGFHLSGVDTTKIKNVSVTDKATTSDVTVSVNVTTQATQATKSYSGGTLGSATTLEITGPEGTTTLNLANNSNTQTVTDAINAVTNLTGIVATRVNGTTINFNTNDYGSAATINITAVSGSFATTGTGVGTDTVATVNGQSVASSGLTLAANVSNLSLEIDLSSTATGALSSFTVTGSGLQFRLSTDTSDVAHIGLQNLSTAALGGSSGRLSTLKSGGGNDLVSGSAATALSIIKDSLSQAEVAQAHIGGFSKYTLDSAQDMLSSQQENLTAAYSDIMDVNVPEESARLAQEQTLQEAALQALQFYTLQSAEPVSLLQNLIARL